MELLKEIYEEDLGLKKSKINIAYKVRKAARAVLLNELGQVALLYVSNGNYHKLPGGGMEKEEDVSKALEREVLEEVGALISIDGEIGTIIEYRNKFRQLQISYCYFCKTKGELRKPSFTKEEIDNGFSLKWMDLESAIDKIKSDVPNNYVGRFIQYRDSCFLNKAKEIIKVENQSIYLNR